MKKTLHTLDLRNVCYQKRVIIVGDIHGCFDEFMRLLDVCQYSPGDVVVATGDLVDRGPEIAETLDWFRAVDGAYTVEGNHENKYRRYLMGNPVKIANGLDETIEQCRDLDSKCLVAWLGSLPHMIRLPDIETSDGVKPFYVVHAGVDGRKPIDRQRRETCLYVRNLDGKTFFDDEDGFPWWETLDGSYVVASGHIVNEEVQPNDSAYCLDGGAVHGGEMRALVIENDNLTVRSVDCGNNGGE
jgi:serine/threonine protein phosphatase 1